MRMFWSAKTIRKLRAEEAMWLRKRDLQGSDLKGQLECQKLILAIRRQIVEILGIKPDKGPRSPKLGASPILDAVPGADPMEGMQIATVDDIRGSRPGLSGAHPAISSPLISGFAGPGSQDSPACDPVAVPG